MKMHIDIFGSSVCRDIFRTPGSENFKVRRCISNIPISTLYDKPIPIKDETIYKIPLNDFEKRMFKIQIQKNATELLKKSDSDILIIDLADEFMRRNIIDKEKEYTVAYHGENEKEFVSLFPGEQISPLDLDITLIDEKFKRFASDIVYSENNPKGYQEKNICVIEAYYTEQIAGVGEGVLRPHDKKYEIDKCNTWIRKLYSILYKYIQDCKIIKLPMFTYSSENHIRGIHPLGYTPATYDYFISAFRVLCGMSKINKVENLYREQSLDNKLYARVLNSTAVYDISGMKKEIQTMRQEIESLKKEVASLKGK